MNSTISVIKSYLQKVGVKDEIADIYLALCAHSPQTISQLSRSSGIERTRIYRLLDELKQSKLIEVHIHYKRELLSAANIQNLQMLVSQKEREVKALQASLPHIYDLATAYEQHNLPTRVQFYKGIDGIKQMIWNETKAATEVYCTLYNNMQRKVGKTYFASWVQECNSKNVKFRGVISDQFLQDQDDWYKVHQNERLKHWQQRYIAPDTFPITHSTVIYNNVVSYYNWKREDEIFGIEIYSDEIADAQRHFFKLLWKSAVAVEE